MFFYNQGKKVDVCIVTPLTSNDSKLHHNFKHEKPQEKLMIPIKYGEMLNNLYLNVSMNVFHDTDSVKGNLISANIQ